MAKLTMTLGAPGSGKSTWAAAQADAVIVNKDSIRAKLTSQGWVWSPENEKDVIKERDRLITFALMEGKDVISDDTNLAPKHQNQLKSLAIKARARFEVKDFRDVPIETCIERDSKRVGKARVGRDVIIKMATTYLNYNEPTPKFEPYTRINGLPYAIIVDLDGTLCIHNGRSPFDYDKCDTDKVNPAVLATIKAMEKSVQIIYMSGRDDSCRDKTEAWLLDNIGVSYPLYMRKTGDSRKDWIVKGELFDANIRGKHNILFCLDDRTQVVQFWRSLGLTVFQCAEGNF